MPIVWRYLVTARRATFMPSFSSSPTRPSSFNGLDLSSLSISSCNLLHPQPRPATSFQSGLRGWSRSRQSPC